MIGMNSITIQNNTIVILYLDDEEHDSECLTSYGKLMEIPPLTSIGCPTSFSLLSLVRVTAAVRAFLRARCSTTLCTQ
jgi:hypothetical protein